MILWLDAQISPAMAPWLRMRFGIETFAVRDLGLREAEDPNIFAQAKAAGVVVMTKDSDFLELLDRLRPPPQVIWLRCGNTSNARLKQLLTHALVPVLEMIRSASLWWRSATPGEHPPRSPLKVQGSNPFRPLFASTYARLSSAQQRQFFEKANWLQRNLAFPGIRRLCNPAARNLCPASTSTASVRSGRTTGTLAEPRPRSLPIERILHPSC